MNIFQRSLEENKGTGSLLDVGTGCGFFLVATKKRGWKVKGIEPSIQSAEVAKRQYGLDIYNGTLQEYDENGEIADSGENCHLFRK